MSGVVRKVIVVHGQVQGVFFRESCRREAETRGVSGSAENRSDGTVEVILEGAPDDVEAMVSWCHSGPSHAHVTDVHARDEEPQGVEGFTAS